MNPFASLYTAPVQHIAQAEPYDTITSRLRHELQLCGPQTSRELSDKFDLPVGRISALFKHDLSIGRVIKSGVCYLMNDDWDNAAAEEIASAKALLRRNGYAVEKKQ